MSGLIQWSKSTNPTRKNFRFEDLPAYNSTYTYPFLVRICVVKLPRFSGGNYIGSDKYDLIQREFCKLTRLRIHFHFSTIIKL